MGRGAVDPDSNEPRSTWRSGANELARDKQLDWKSRAESRTLFGKHNTMSHYSSPSGSLGRAAGTRAAANAGGEPGDGVALEADAAQPSLSTWGPPPARVRNPTPESLDLGDAQEDTTRLGLPRSLSSQSVMSLESASSAAHPYSSLQYAPRQRSNHSYRASQISFQSHGSLWKQQQQQQSSSTSASLETPSPSLLTASNATASSPVLSTTAIEGVPNSSAEQQAGSNSTTEQVGAAERLAKQQLRADAEELGLRVGSLGWAILERIQSATEGEWRELGEMLSRGEATLLLPTSPLRVQDVTLSHAYNHVVFSTTSSIPSILFVSSAKGKERETASLVTFKGLRAELIDDSSQKEPQLAFKSFVPREDMRFVVQMRVAARRAELFSTLAPLPYTSNLSGLLPSFKILAHSSNLLLPPSLSRRDPAASQATRSRSGSSGTYLSPDQRQANRASASFATLFGGRRDKRASMISISSEGKELKEMNEAGDSMMSGGTYQVAQPTRSIAVVVIDGEIHRSHVLADLTSSMTTRVRQLLRQHGDSKALPEDIIDVVCSFAAIFVPPSLSATARPSPSADARWGSMDSEMMKSPTSPVVQAPFLYSPDYLADSFQDFFSSIRTQLEEAKGDFNVDQELQRIEATVCSEVYDRIFCPYVSLDVFHDDALTYRVDALNDMALSLHHLGLVLPEREGAEGELVRLGLDDIVTRCGAQLKSLGDRRCVSPADKLGVLVAAHKVIVEGLGQLPKIELVDDIEAQKKEGVQSDDAKEAAERAGPSTSSADLILPILIYCIIKSNPPKLASNLLYIQRFRAESLIQGEASYCLVNVQAAVAFLENVEPSSLGLQSDREMVTAKMLERQSRRQYNEAPSASVEDNYSLSMPMRMRSRVAHDVGELAGMSNRAITGVLGSSLGAFGRMMGAGTTFAMGIEAGGPRSANEADQSQKKSVEDIRGILTGGATSKLGSVINKVVAIENEGKAQRETGEQHSRPRPMPRSSSARIATDYGDEETGNGANALWRSKQSISDRLASLPLLSRSSPASSSPPASHLPLQQNTQGRPASPAQEAKDLPGRLPAPDRPEKLLLEAAYRVEGLRSPISPASYLDPSLLLSPANSHSQPDASSTPRVHIPASLQSPYLPLSQPPTSERPLHVVLASTGSVASVKVPLIVESLLQHDNVCVQIISTKASARFYDGRALLSSAGKRDPSRAYTVADLARENREAAREVKTEQIASPPLHLWTDEDEWEQWSEVGDAILHIELRRWADVVLVAPCSANTLAKINAGTCDDLLVSACLCSGAMRR